MDADHARRAALERGDDLVQQLAVAKYALSIGDTARTMDALDEALRLSRVALSELVEAAGSATGPSFAGMLVRQVAAPSAPIATPAATRRPDPPQQRAAS